MFISLHENRKLIRKTFFICPKSGLIRDRMGIHTQLDPRSCSVTDTLLLLQLMRCLAQREIAKNKKFTKALHTQ